MPATAEQLRQVIAEFLGGSETRYRHPVNRRFIYSEGMKTAMEAAGGYWLLDILATECAPLVKQAFEAGRSCFGIVKMTVADGRAQLRLELQDDVPPVWAREIAYTDFPEGEWSFYLGVDEMGNGEIVVTAFVPSEY